MHRCFHTRKWLKKLWFLILKFAFGQKLYIKLLNRLYPYEHISISKTPEKTKPEKHSKSKKTLTQPYSHVPLSFCSFCYDLTRLGSCSFVLLYFAKACMNSENKRLLFVYTVLMQARVLPHNRAPVQTRSLAAVTGIASLQWRYREKTRTSWAENSVRTPQTGFSHLPRNNTFLFSEIRPWHFPHSWRHYMYILPFLPAFFSLPFSLAHIKLFIKPLPSCSILMHIFEN